MKIMTIVGARPQLIKEAVFSKEIAKQPNIQEYLVHTGQHYDANMSGIFFDVLNMKKPDINLEIGSGSHGEMTGRIMIALEPIVKQEKPDVIVVYGDTNSTVAAALVGSKLHIPIAHIEAGLRQFPKDMPEELNRVVTDHLSSILLCPSSLAIENLNKEGIVTGVYNTGDIMYDLFVQMEKHFDYSLLEELNLSENNYVVTTLHRDFTVDDPALLEKALTQLGLIAQQMPVILPLHPRTKNRIGQFGLELLLAPLTIIEPIDYVHLMGLISLSHSVVTDSGGLQKEAYFAHKRAVVVMEDTAWIELIQNKWNLLSSVDEIFNNWNNMRNLSAPYIPHIYGDGKAGEKILQSIITHMSM